MTFTNSDVRNNRIQVALSELVADQPNWMKRGLQQTASGYGPRLNSGYKIRFNGKLYRVYATCFSNAASHWFTVKGQRIYIY